MFVHINALEYGIKKEEELVDVDVTVKMTIKDFPKQAIAVGAKDCVTILVSDALKKIGYSSDIQRVDIECVKGE